MGSDRIESTDDAGAGPVTTDPGGGGAVPHAPPAGTPCDTCSSALSGRDDLVVQSYPTPEREDAVPCRVACPECADEVAELVDAWTPLAEPPVDPERPIGAWYAAVADACGFCGRTREDGVAAGVECYRAGPASGDAPRRHRHYALCSHCLGVFEQFLADVAAADGTEGEPS